MSENPQILSLQNSHISRSFAVSDAGALTTVSLLNRRTGKQFALADPQGNPLSREFSLLWKGRWLHGHPDHGGSADFVFVRSSQRAETTGAQSLEIYLVTPDGDLEVRLICEAHPDLPITRKWLVASNLGAEPGCLDAVSWEDLAISPAVNGDTHTAAGLDLITHDRVWRGPAGERIVCVFDSQGHEGFALLNEAPGPSAALDINTDGLMRARASFSPCFGGISLEPGSSFTTPPASIILFDTRNPEDGPTPRLHDVFRRILPGRGRLSPLTIHRADGPTPDQGGPAWMETKLLLSSSAGIPALLIEGGGMRRVGGFEVDPELLHGGLGHAAHQLGAKDIALGVSLPLAEIGADCAVAQERPEWMCLDGRGRRAAYDTPRGPRVMACLASGYKDHLLDRIVELHQQTRIATLHLTGPVARAQPGGFAPCHDPAHNHQGPNDAALEIGRALQELFREVARRCPGLTLGLDEELWAMPAPPDPIAAIHVADFVRVGHVEDMAGRRGPFEARCIFYRRVRCLPPEALAVGSLRLDGPNPVASLATAYAGFPMISGQLERVTSGQIDWLRTIAQWHTQLSRQISFHERFFLLHGSLPIHPLRWDGYAKLSREGEGFLAVFRNRAANDEQVFPVPGLDVASRCRLESVIRDRVLGVFSAQELAKGLAFEIPFEDGADIIQIQRVEG